MRRLLLIALLGIAGCATTANYEKILQSYVGSNESSLIAHWGPPDSVYTSGETKYLTYNKTSSTMVSGTPPTYQTNCAFGTCTTTPVGGSSPYVLNLQCKTTFTISGGTITSWRWEGNACRAKAPSG